MSLPIIFEEILSIVRNDGMELANIHASLSDEQKLDLYLEAVKQNGLALQFVPPTFNTIEIVLSAVEQNIDALQFVCIYNNEELATILYDKYEFVDLDFLVYSSSANFQEKLKNFIIELIMHGHMSLKHSKFKIPIDSDMLIAELIAKTNKDYQELPEELRKETVMKLELLMGNIGPKSAM